MAERMDQYACNKCNTGSLHSTSQHMVYVGETRPPLSTEVTANVLIHLQHIITDIEVSCWVA